ncbi:hypothetical protein N0M98_11180 [Paenibacillus doosanensis]|nr:hypothetical protein [Paenibacillus doosanensis]
MNDVHMEMSGAAKLRFEANPRCFREGLRLAAEAGTNPPKAIHAADAAPLMMKMGLVLTKNVNTATMAGEEGRFTLVS